MRLQKLWKELRRIFRPVKVAEEESLEALKRMEARLRSFEKWLQ